MGSEGGVRSPSKRGVGLTEKGAWFPQEESKVVQRIAELGRSVQQRNSVR